MSVNSQSLSNITQDEATDFFDRLPFGPVHLQIMRHPEVCSPPGLSLLQTVPLLTIFLKGKDVKLTKA